MPRGRFSNPPTVPSRESAQGFLKLFHGGLPGPGIALPGQNRGPKADLRYGKAGVTGDLCGRRRLPRATQVLRCAEVDHPHRHRHTDGSVDERDDNGESRPDDFPAPSQAKDCQEFTLPHRADRGPEKDEDDCDADKRGGSEYFLLSREDPPPQECCVGLKRSGADAQRPLDTPRGIPAGHEQHFWMVDRSSMDETGSSGS